MNPGQNPSDALASILALLNQSTQNQLQTNGTSSSLSTTYPRHEAPPQPLEPVFADSDILDTSQWIGTTTTSWYEPRNWQFPRINLPSNGLRSSIPSSRPPVPPAKRPRSSTPEANPPKTSIKPVNENPTLRSRPFTYAQALKHVVNLSHSDEFVETIKQMKRKQHDLETDLHDERNRLKQKWESKRKMDKILQSLGSECIGDQVLNKLEAAELEAHDKEIYKRWQETAEEQSRRLGELGVPYFSSVSGETEGKRKILALLEDLIQEN